MRGPGGGAGVGWPVTLNEEAEEILLFLSLFFAKRSTPESV